MRSRLEPSWVKNVRWVGVGVVVMAALTAAACSGGGDPSGTPSPRAEESKAESDPPTWKAPKPEKPQKMNERTAAGAEALVRYYYESFDYARRIEDWSGVEKLSTDDCHACKELMTSESFKYRPEGPAQRKVDAPRFDPGEEETAVFVQRFSAPGTWQANLYEDPRRFAKQQWQDIFFLVYEEGRWLVDGIEIYRRGTVKDPTAPYRW